MICFIALIVSSLLGIFSATHRKIAKEAFRCMFYKIQFKPCTTGLDDRLKASITGPLIASCPKLGSFLFRYFAVFSWMFLLLLLASTAYVVYGGYNYYLYGNCNGPQEQGFCLFDPTGKYQGVTHLGDEGLCVATADHTNTLTLEGFNTSLFITFNPTGYNEVVFFGCYFCEYTRKAYPEIRRLRDRFDVTFTFVHVDVKNHSTLYTDIGNCLAQQDPYTAFAFADYLLLHPMDNDTFAYALEKSYPDYDLLTECLKDPAIQQLRHEQEKAIAKTGIYGTPLVFVNGNPIVGPKPYRVYSRYLR